MGYKRKFNIYYATPQKLKYARELRLNMTPAEKKLWGRIKLRQLGITFVTQKIILGYIIDFYNQKYRLAIEVDGYLHDPVADAKRTKHLTEHGIYVLRFPNDEVLFNIEKVLDKIRAEISIKISLYNKYIESKRKQNETNMPKRYPYPRIG